MCVVCVHVCICAATACEKKAADREAEVKRGIFLRNDDEQAEECTAMHVWAGGRREA